VTFDHLVSADDLNPEEVLAIDIIEVDYDEGRIRQKQSPPHSK